MKSTPINFANILEPELKTYWEEKDHPSGTKVEIQRSHNFQTAQTVLNAIAVPRTGNPSILMSIQLIDIPQQEDHPAINCLLHFPFVDQPTPMLMVFKEETDREKWVRKIMEKVAIVALSAPEPEPEPQAESTTE